MSAAAGLVMELAELAPRLRLEPDRIWADGRGMDPVALAVRLLDCLEAHGVAAPAEPVTRAGVAAVPVVAELAARWGAPSSRQEAETPFLVKERTGFGWRRSAGPPAGPSGEVADRSNAPVVIPRGEEAEWLGALPVAALEPDPRLRALFDGVGLTRLAELASLAREAVEVRFGPKAVELWRLARADDSRILFQPVPPAVPHGSIDFVDYVLTDPARLLFTANSLLGPICRRLTRRGLHARALQIILPLANGDTWTRTLRPARPTASRETWLRLVRALLERLTVPDAVTGMLVTVADTEAAAVRQGDLFDRGFATASAVEAAIARLVERQVTPLTPHRSAHPLLERRTEWRPTPIEQVAREIARPPRTGSADDTADTADTADTDTALSLRLLPDPRRITVEAVRRRDHQIPFRIRDRGGWRHIPLAAGPDRISGGQWEERPYAREYFRCVTEEGVLLWVYRDALDGSWHLHGWWD